MDGKKKKKKAVKSFDNGIPRRGRVDRQPGRSYSIAACDSPVRRASGEGGGRGGAEGGPARLRCDECRERKGLQHKKKKRPGGFFFPACIGQQIHDAYDEMMVRSVRLQYF